MAFRLGDRVRIVGLDAAGYVVGYLAEDDGMIVVDLYDSTDRTMWSASDLEHLD